MNVPIHCHPDSGCLAFWWTRFNVIDVGKDSDLMTRTPETRKALTLVLDAMGGDVEISWQPTPLLSKVQRIKRRFQVDESVATSHPSGVAVYPWWSDATEQQTVAILHSTSDGAKDGLYGSGQKAAITRQALRPQVQSHQVTELGVVNVKVEGSPTSDQCLTGRPLMLQALDAADTRFVLLHGAHALHAWRPDLTLKQYAGKVGLWNRRWWVVPVPQVDGITTRRSEWSMEDWLRMVGRFVDLSTGPDPFHHIERLCVHRERDGVCGRGAGHWDEDAVPYCEEHWAADQQKKGKVLRKKARDEVKLNKGVLFE